MSFLSLIIESKSFFKLFLNFFTCYFYHHLSAPIEFFFSLLALHFRWDLQFFEPFSFFFFFVSFGIKLVNLRLIADDIGFTLQNYFFFSNEKIILSFPSFSVLFSKDSRFFEKKNKFFIEKILFCSSNFFGLKSSLG